ncbi:MFS transporter, partial [Sphingobium jiangsuense]
MTATALPASGAAERFTPRTLLSLLLCALVMVIDGYDLAAMPLAVPHVTRAFDLPPADFGLALSAVLLGLGLGAVLLAPLGDRLGRRRVIVLGAAVLGLTILGAASGTTVAEFALWRLVNGMALGACLPNVTAL